MPLCFLERIGVMPKRYPQQVRQRAIRMVIDHLEEYDSVYKASFAIGPKVGVAGESLRRWVQEELAKGTAVGDAVAQQRAETKRIKELERKVRDLEEANEILKAASIFFAGELDPRRQG
jgi:transposase-like protein